MQIADLSPDQAAAFTRILDLEREELQSEVRAKLAKRQSAIYEETLLDQISHLRTCPLFRCSITARANERINNAIENLLQLQRTLAKLPTCKPTN